MVGAKKVVQKTIDSQQVRRCYDVNDDVVVFDESTNTWKDGVVTQIVPDYSISGKKSTLENKR